MAMKLYYYPGACSLAPHIALREANLEFELERVDLATKQTASGAPFAAVNPKGQVPALALESDAVLTEVPAILQYVADRAPRTRLAPSAGTIDRYRLQEWLNFVTAELHKGLGALFRPDVPDAWRKVVLDTVGARLGYLDRHLKGGQYLMNGTFTVADSYAFTILNWASYVRIELAPWPAVQGYLERIAARPSVRQAMRAEGLIG